MKLTVGLSTICVHPQSIQGILEDLANQTVKIREIIVCVQCKDSQCVKEKYRSHINGMDLNFKVQIITSTEFGVLKSRNIVMSACSGDILLFADDDCRYPDDCCASVISPFIENTDIVAASYKISVNHRGDVFKPYPDNVFMHNKISAQRVNMISLAIVIEYVRVNQIKFDERFGHGTRFPSCGENIFLCDILDRSGVAIYHPSHVVIHPKDSSGGRLGCSRTLEGKGAGFYRMFGIGGSVLCLIFAIKKSKDIRSFARLLKYLYLGYIYGLAYIK